MKLEEIRKLVEGGWKDCPMCAGIKCPTCGAVGLVLMVRLLEVAEAARAYLDKVGGEEWASEDSMLARSLAALES